MASETLSLNGTWELTYRPEPPGACSDDDAPDWPPGESVAAHVPGNVELDLVRAGRLADPFVGMNVKELRRYEEYEWWYRRRFQAGSPSEAGRAVLVLEGIDCFGTIWLNGHRLGATDNMLIPHEFDVTEHLRSGQENELVVRIGSAVRAARRYTYDPSLQSLPTNLESAFVRKAPHMYGWDIAPRIVSAGLWRGVELQYRPATRIVDVHYRTTVQSESRARLHVSWQIESDRVDLGGLTLHMQGQCESSRFEREVPVRFVAGQFVIDVPDARLWWPAGYGPPDRHDFALELRHDGNVLDRRTDRIGLCEIKLIRREPAGPNGEFRFDVNGTPILVKGSNWVPLDAFHSRDAERYERALDLFADLGCNMLRCWGGNVYEDHAFFDLCERRGIMVWQDFAMACGRYPQDPAFLDRLRKEAETIVRRLRNHCCIAVWCGDNECDYSYLWQGLDPASNRITRETLKQVVERCDPWRAYVPSSPWFTPDIVEKRDESRSVEQHLWGPRDYFKSRFYTESTPHFIGEIGYHGSPGAASIRRFIDPDHVWPPRGDEQWILHASDSIGADGPYAYRVELMLNQIRELFGIEPTTLEDFVLASQISQAEAKKFFIEMVRLGKWRRTGLLWWNVIDCWPQFSDAVVDYYFARKLAYSYIKRVQRPMCIMIGEPESWHCRVVAGNDSRSSASGEYRVSDADSGKVLMSGKFGVAANANQELGRLRVSHGEQRCFLIEWDVDGRRHGNHYLLGKPPISLVRYRGWLDRIAALPEPFDWRLHVGRCELPPTGSQKSEG
ncbi:MAG: glycoside hydrolase family 2 [Phycisphaerae bacterium]|nr:glycoside hydrolase family 2 [Phycisphaerae bacterium]